MSDSVAASVLKEGTPAEVEMSATGLEQALDLYRLAVQQDRLTGIVVLVARRGRIVLQEALGQRDRERMLSMRRDTLCRMASNTKTVVAASILMLAEEGALDLSDPVSKHLRGFEGGLSRALTIQDLLRHTTGFSNQLDNFVGPVTTETSSEFPDAPSLRVEAVKIGRVGPVERPGRRFVYNNWGYTILGAIVERLSGQKIDAFLAEHLYRPLGLANTFHDLFPQPERLALNYAKDSGEWKILPPDTPPFVRSTGGMVTTARDFAAICQMYLNRGTYGEKQILRPETVRAATSVQSRGPDMYIQKVRLTWRGLVPAWYYAGPQAKRLGIEGGYGYGYGWVVAGNGAFHHGGFRGTFAYVDPAEELIILLFAQSRTGGNPGHQFISKVYEAIQ